MQQLEQKQLQLVNGGCQAELTCQNTTLAMLEICSYPELQQINQILRDVAKRDALQDATGEQRKAAYLAAIQAAEF